MVDIKTLLPELKKLVTDLSEDLLARSTATAEIDAGLREAYTQIEKGGRTADAFEVWREDYLDQVAVAWVLGCVFVRFMEDNHLIDECWLAGEGDRRKLAEDSHELYFREHPRESDRNTSSMSSTKSARFRRVMICSLKGRRRCGRLGRAVMRR